MHTRRDRDGFKKLIAPRRPMRNTLAHRPSLGQHGFIEVAGNLGEVAFGCQG